MKMSKSIPSSAVFITDTPEEIRAKLNASATQKVFTVDATKIAVDCIGRALPNAPMLGFLILVLTLLLIPFLVSAAQTKASPKAKKQGWMKNYQPKNQGEQELLKACAYGNIAACHAYHERYIQPGN
jgi:pyruvate ferredoxin oxidoreductase gamma subunit